MLFVTIQELEAAINYWRSQSPSVGDELRFGLSYSALLRAMTSPFVSRCLIHDRS